MNKKKAVSSLTLLSLVFTSLPLQAGAEVLTDSSQQVSTTQSSLAPATDSSSEMVASSNVQNLDFSQLKFKILSTDTLHQTAELELSPITTEGLKSLKLGLTNSKDFPTDTSIQFFDGLKQADGTYRFKIDFSKIQTKAEKFYVHLQLENISGSEVKGTLTDKLKTSDAQPTTESTTTAETSTSESTSSLESSTEETSSSSEGSTSISSSEASTSESSTSSSSTTSTSESTSTSSSSSISKEPIKPVVRSAVASAPTVKPKKASFYVQVINRYYSIWSSFSWTKKDLSSRYMNQTLQVRIAYSHTNGSTYYSLYNNKGKWIGYLNSTATKKVEPQGAWHGTTKYVSITQPKWTVWNNFHGSARYLASTLSNRVVKVTGYYKHFNGATYYSMYDKNNKWLGYINSGGVKEVPIQGSWRAMNKYVTISQPSWTVWNNFKGSAKYRASALNNQVVKVTGYYKHFNGATYYSMFDKNNKWLGYINSGGVKEAPQQGYYHNFNKYVRITKNYNVWSNFNWKFRSTAYSIKNQTIIAKGYYKHFNGSTYYSLYKTNGQWLGYINSGATAVTSTPKNYRYKKLNVVNYNQYKWGIPVGCEGVSLLEALQFKGRAKNYTPTTFLKTIPKSTNRSPYTGFVGSPFVEDNWTYTAIFNKPLAKWGARFGNVTDISGSSVNTLLNEVMKGNPVVSYVTIHFAPLDWYLWNFGYAPNNNHAVTLSGYDEKAGKVYVSDPIDGKYWMSLNTFSKIYNARKMAVVVR